MSSLAGPVYAGGDITHEGAVLMGDTVCCDGFVRSRNVGVITHAHADHIGGFERCLGNYSKILLTKVTKEMIFAMKGQGYDLRRNLIGMDYGKTISLGREEITLYSAEHMLGAAQVLVRDREGRRIVYTGDFNCPGTKPIESDVLIIDATYGHPDYDFAISHRKFAEESLLDKLRAGVEKHSFKPLCVYARRGRIQEIMHMVRMRGIQEPFLTTDCDYRVAKVYENVGRSIGDVFTYDSPKGKQLTHGGSPYIGFRPLPSRRPYPLDETRILISTYNAIGPYTCYSKGRTIKIAIPDHADFNAIIGYVKKSKPGLVISSTCQQQGYVLSDEIKVRLGIDAVALPDS